MFRWSIVVLILALVAGILGFTALGGQYLYVARDAFYGILVVFILGALFYDTDDHRWVAR